jgi:hemolysin activation/secretion protein
MLWRQKLEWVGLWNLDTNKPEDIIVDYRMRYFKNQTKRRSFFATFNAIYTKNLNTNQQVFYGGDTGARGYKNRLLVGTRRVALTLEERLYSDVHLFNLFRLGWAIFVDVGKAWEPGVDSGFEDDYLANIGFGFRFASTKADAGRVIHIDIAFPMTNRDDDEVNSSEVSIKVKNQF